MTVTTGTTSSTGAPLPRPEKARFGTGARVLLGVVSALLLLTGWALLAAGAIAVGADTMARDGNGYLMSDTTEWTSPGYAVQSDTVLVHQGPMGFSLPHRMLGRFHVTAVPTGTEGVFVGIASADDVTHYLRDVARTTMTDPYSDVTTSRFVDGGSPRVAPADADFWVASTVGAGPQELTWDPRPGSWRLVVMNASGTTPVAADVAVGAEAPVLNTAGPVLLTTGVVLLVAAAAGGVLCLRRS
ncbi:hypothetical protein GCM10023146_43950 [Nocardioides caricicola]